MRKRHDNLGRLIILEAKKKAQAATQEPSELFGRYYDSLTPAERWKWWQYMYAGYRPFHTLEEYERFELRQMDRDNLHFKCRQIPSMADMTEFEELEAESIKMSRRDWI